MHSNEQTDPRQMPSFVKRSLGFGFWGIVLAIGGFVVWATAAPLSTTIHTSGHLQATAPIFALQHPFGGRVAEVMVKEQQSVDRGDTILRLDVSVERKHLQETQKQLARLVLENQEIQSYLGTSDGEAQADFPARNGKVRSILTKRAAQKETTLARVSQIKKQLRFIEEETGLLRKKETVLAQRFDDLQQLQAKGAATTKDTNNAMLQLLNVQTQIAGKMSQLDTLEFERTDLLLSLKQTKKDYEYQLVEWKIANERSISDLEMKKAELIAVVGASLVKSPIPGVVVDLQNGTHGTVLERAQTVASVVRETGRYTVQFNVSPNQIDQVKVGMQGKVTIASLPQRSMPKIQSKIVSLSPKLKYGKSGEVIGYPGVAEMSEESSLLLQSAVGDETRLSNDMPVSLTISGRKLTFWTYLIAPFLNFRERAFQD